jgi:heat shock protein HslJ
MKNLLIFLILFASCRPSNQIGEMVGSIQQRSLEDTVWIAVELAGKPVVASNDKAPFFKLLVADHKVHGFGGCNTLNGSYIKEGNKLSAQLITTRMFCEGKMDMEQALINALNTSVKYDIIQDVLTLKYEGKVVAIFKAEAEKLN